MTVREVPAGAARAPPTSHDPGEEPYTLVTRKGKKNDATSLQQGTSNNANQKPSADVGRVARRIRRKPAAVLVKVGGALTYADTLRKVRETEVDFDSLGTKVTSMRKTISGDLIVELTKSNKSLTAVDVLRDKIAAVIPDSSVKCLRQTSEVKIVDLDEVTTKEEVHAALLKSSNADGSTINVTCF